MVDADNSKKGAYIMKSKYILASAFSLAIVGASVVSPFSYAGWFEELGDSAQAMYDVTSWFADWISITVGEEMGQYGCIVLSNNGDETIHHIRVTSTQEWKNYNQVRYSFDHDYQETRTNWQGYTDGGRGSCDIFPQRIAFRGTNYYFDQSNHSNYVVYCDLPMVYNTDSTESSSLNNTLLANPTKAKFTPNTASNFLGNIQLVVEQYEPEVPTVPPYTDSAPGFPNLPNEWVNGNGNTYNIDLPDFDFNLELPTYTMPEAVSIPAEFVQKSSALYQVPLNIIDRFGLWWLVGLALICTVITLIINR